MWPSALEDVLACHELGLVTDAQLAEHPEHAVYTAGVAGALHGQASHVQRGRQSTGNLRDPAAIAFERLLRDRRASAVRAQLDALKPYQRSADAAEEPIPF